MKDYFYYDIAYKFRNIKKEVDFIEKIFKKYSDIKVKKILDVGCGTCEHAIELAKRGYYVLGIDIDKNVLEYAKQKYKNKNFEVKLLDERNVGKLNKKFDAAISLSFSLAYLINVEDFKKHIIGIKKVLKKGSIYVVEMPFAKEFLSFDKKYLDFWEEKFNDKIAKVEYKTVKIDWKDLIIENEFKILNEKNKLVFYDKFKYKIYTLSELKMLFEDFGKMKIVNVFGSLRGEKFGKGSEIVLIVKNNGPGGI